MQTALSGVNAAAAPSLPAILSGTLTLYCPGNRLGVVADLLGAAQALPPALLRERRPLNPSATRLIFSLSYYLDDLALLSWNGALLKEHQ